MANNITLLTIAGRALKNPSTYSAITADIVDSGRNVNGMAVFDVVRSDVAKVSVSWNYLTSAEWSEILSIFRASFINSVRFFNQVTNTFDTRQMYVSDRTSGISLIRDNQIGWGDCKLSLVEV